MGRFLVICHVLRYTDFFTTVYNVIQRGLLGRVISVQHAENIAWYHFSHSYVRGGVGEPHALLSSGSG